MPMTELDGIRTRYRVVGEGPPLLMFSPGGFDATLDKWWESDSYQRIRIMEWLPSEYTCITFDRRENGESGGRFERVTWNSYARQGKQLLDFLGFESALVLGGCMGCPTASEFATRYTEATNGLVLWWPVGGARYRIRAELRFAAHLAFVQNAGLGAVVAESQGAGRSFSKDPKLGPWTSVLGWDAQFAEELVETNTHEYLSTVIGMRRALFDHDTAPGPEPEDLMRVTIPTLVVPGDDESHAPSAARYLHECLAEARFWDSTSEEQVEGAQELILGFLSEVR
jgi:pimeloyl-ACP methyl ester carboxylesterase